MTRQATDNLYIELEYFTPEEYYNYEAVAASALTAESTLACEGNVTASGEIVMASGDFPAFATLTATISHIEGADLFAFAEAALAVAVDRIRGNNISATAVFDIATDGRRFRDVAAAEESQFDFDAIIERSREFNIETQAAFSFDVVGTTIRFIDSSLLSTTELAAIISHIEGTDIVVNGFASLSAELSNVRKETSVALTSSATMQINGGFVKSFNSNLQSTAVMIVLPRILVRNTQIVANSGGIYNSVVIDTSVKKFGAGSLSFTIQPNISPESDAVWNGTNFRYIQAGYTWTSTDGLSWTRQSNNLGINLYNIIWTNDRYISFDTMFGNTIYSSTDGLSWSSVNFSTTELGFRRDVVFFTGGFYYIYGSYIASTARIAAMRSTSLSGPWTRVDIFNTGVAPGLFGGPSLDNVNWNQTGYVVLSFAADTVPVNLSTTRTSYVLRLGAGDANLISRSATVFSSGQYSVSFNSVKADFAESKSQIAIDAYSAASNSRFLRFSTNNGSNWTNNTNITNIQSIRHINDRWMISTTAGLYTGTNVNSLTLVNPNVTQSVSYGSNKWLARSSTPGYASYSSNSTTWNYDAIDPQPLPASLDYSRGNNSDISSFKTLDFWMYHNATDGRKFFFVQDINNFINFSIGTNYAELKSVASGTSYTLRVDKANIVSNNTWNHFRVSVDGSLAALYVNGVREAYITNFVNSTVAPFTIGGDPLVKLAQETFKLDEMLISDQLLTPTSTISFNIPTDRWYNDSTEKDLLLHFDTDFNDDTRFDPIISAGLTTVAQVSATVGVDYKFTADITANSSLICLGQKSVETILSAFGDAALTVQALRIQQLEINVESQSSLSSAVNKLTNVESNQSSTTTVDVQAVVTRSAQIATESIATQLTAVVRLAGLIADDLVTTNLTADAVVTRSAVSSLESNASVFADNFKIRFNSIDLASEFNTTVATLVGKIANSDMSAVFEQTTNVLRSRDNTATLTVNSELTAIVNNLGKIEGSLFNAATLTITAVKTVSVQSQLESLTAVSAISSRTRPYESSLTTVATQQSVARKAVEVSLSLSAFASKLTVAVKNTVGLADLETVSSQTCSAVKIASGQTNLVSESQFSAAITKTTRITATLPANFAVVAEGTTSIQGEANLQALAFQISAVGRVAAFFIDASITSSLSASGNLTRSIESTLNSEFNQSTLTSRSRDAFANLQTTVIQITVGSRVRTFVIPIASAMTFVSEVREIHIEEIVYVIPGEIWEYDINSETRLQVIGSESREYIIT